MAGTLMINGEVIPPGTTPLVLLDDGLVRGDGVFEGMRSYGRRLRTLDDHLARLERSAREISLRLDVSLIRSELGAFVRQTKDANCGVRLLVTRSGQRILREEAVPVLPVGCALAPVAHRVSPLLARAKTLSYAANMQAHRLAQGAGADEALMYRADDRVVLEAPTASFLWCERGQWYAPPIETTGVLDSLTRRLLSRVVSVQTAERTVEDVCERAEAAMLVSTYLESVAVGSIAGGSALDPHHPMVTSAQAALADATDRSLTPLP